MIDHTLSEVIHDMATLNVMNNHSSLCCGNEECDSSYVINRGGFFVCGDCGTVISHVVVFGTYEAGTGVPDEGYDVPSAAHSIEINNTSSVSDGLGLGSNVGYASGKLGIHNMGFTLTGKELQTAYKMKYHQNYTRMIFNDEIQRRTLIEIQRTCAILLIPVITKRRACFLTKTIIKKCRKMKIDDDDIINSILIAVSCIIYATKEYNNAVKESDIIDMWAENHNVNTTSINRAKFWLQKNTEMKFIRTTPLLVVPQTISMLKDNPKIIQRLYDKEVDLNSFFYQLDRKVKFIFENTGFSVYGGRDPFTLVASCCYSASSMLTNKRYLSQKMIADASNIAEFTIRDHHKMWKKVIPKLRIPRFDV